jgi:hypothetical protein
MMYGVCATNGSSVGSTGVISTAVVTDHSSHSYHHNHTQHNSQPYDNGYPDCAFYAYPTPVANYSTAVSESGTDFLLDQHQHHQTSIKGEPYCPPPLVYNHHHHHNHHNHHQQPQYELSSPDPLVYNYTSSSIPPTGKNINESFYELSQKNGKL